MGSKNKNCFADALTSIDTFGINFNFHVNGSDKLKTGSGATITIIYVIILVGLFMGFGIDLYERKKPKVSLNTDAKEHSVIKLSNKNFTYAFRLENIYGQKMDDKSKVYQEVGYLHYISDNGTWKLMFLESLPVTNCSDLSYTTEKEKYYNISLRDWNCINFDNLTFGGNWDGNFVYGLIIYTKQCTNNTDTICSSKEEIKKYISLEDEPSALFYSDLSLEVYPRMQEIDSPLISKFVNRYEMLNLGLYKRKVQTYKITNMINDVGWFLPEIKNEDPIVSSDFVQSDFSFKSLWTNDILYTQFIYLGRKVDTYNRSYVKIQEVFASIGGFSKICFFLINCLYRYLANTYRSLYLLSNISFDYQKGNHNEGSIIRFNKASSFSKLDNQYEGNYEIKSTEKPGNKILNKMKLPPLKTDSFYNSKSSLKMVQLDFDNSYNIPNNKIFKNEENFNVNLPLSENSISIYNKNSNNKYKNSNNKYINIIAPHNKIKNNFDENLPESFTNRNINKILNNKNEDRNETVNCLDLIKKKICSLKNNKIGNFYKIDNYTECQIYLKKHLDILNYFKIMNEFKNLKKVLLDNSERQKLKLKKPIIKTKVDISSKKFAFKKTSNLDSKLEAEPVPENVIVNNPRNIEINK